MNVAPDAERRFELDPTAVRLDEAAGQSKAQTRPACRCVLIADLAELLEDAQVVLGGDPDAVVAAQRSGPRRVDPRRADQMQPSSGVYLMAFESRLYRIWRRRPGSASTTSGGSTTTSTRWRLRSASGRMPATDAPTAWPISTGFDGQFEPARLDLGEVEDIVDQGQQVVATAADVLDPLARDGQPSHRPPARTAISELNPMIALRGVRSSWLMLARKSLFAALAGLEGRDRIGEPPLSASCSARTSRRWTRCAERMPRDSTNAASSASNRLGRGRSRTIAPISDLFRRERHDLAEPRAVAPAGPRSRVRAERSAPQARSAPSGSARHPRHPSSCHDPQGRRARPRR